MPRPKGSKNKKNLRPAAQITAQIAAQQEVKNALDAEIAEILAGIEEKKTLLKNKKKALRKAEKALLALEVKKAEAETIEAAAAQENEIKTVVSKLISSGKSAEEILELLKK